MLALVLLASVIITMVMISRHARRSPRAFLKRRGLGEAREWLHGGAAVEDETEVELKKLAAKNQRAEKSEGVAEDRETKSQF